MKLKYGAILAFLLCVHTCFSQEATKQDRYFMIAEAGFIKGLSAGYAEGTDQSAPDAASLRLIGGVFLSPGWSVGVGIGLDGYSKEYDGGLLDREHYNTMPVFIDGRYYFQDERNTPFLFTDIGYSLKLSDNFERGVMIGIGGGYKFFIGKRTCLIAGLGYNFQQIQDVPFAESDNLNLHSANLQVGFLF